MTLIFEQKYRYVAFELSRTEARCCNKALQASGHAYSPLIEKIRPPSLGKSQQQKSNSVEQRRLVTLSMQVGWRLTAKSIPHELNTFCPDDVPLPSKLVTEKLPHGHAQRVELCSIKVGRSQAQNNIYQNAMHANISCSHLGIVQKNPCLKMCKHGDA